MTVPTSQTDASPAGQERSAELMTRIMAAAQPGAVFSQPVTAGDYTVITASEVTAGGGFGYGTGSSGEQASGGGGGGGGGSMGRPVAVITIGPNGVKVKPIVDPTKIVLAGLTAWGAMLGILVRMRRGRR